jgi:acetolactate synthase-1/2/3 large subunit
METGIPRADFAQIARAVGAIGIRVEDESELESALARAMASSGPVVVDVLVDGAVPPPFGSRNASLRAQGVEITP